MPQGVWARAALAALAGFLAGVLLGLGTGLPEYALLDLRMAMVAHLVPSGAVETRTAVILMDRHSESVLGVPQGPEWRPFHATLIENLNRAGASVIVFDAEFAATSPWDEGLAAACRTAGNVVAGEINEGSTTPVLAAGFRALGDLDVGLARERPRWVDVHAGRPPPISALVAGLLTGVPAAAGRWWIDFRYPIEAIPAFSYSDVLRADADRLADEGRTPLSVFQGRVVLIGKDLPFAGDSFPYPHTLGKAYPGVYGQAYAVETLLRGRGLLPAGPVADIALILAAAALSSMALTQRRRPLRWILVAAISLAVLLLPLLLLGSSGVWLGASGVVAALLAVLATQWITQRLWLRGQLRRALGFRPELIESFRAAARRSSGTIQRNAVVVCSDVRSYTKYVREHPPEAVARVLSSYVAAMERIVTDHGGYVNKYVGDEIVAIFGFPLSEEGCERRGVQAALRMQEEMARLRTEWAARGDPPLEAIGIGVDSGSLTFAEMGVAAKVQFDIIGDPVNGASRLQAATKELGRPVLVSADCFRLVDSAKVASIFETLGYVSLRGQGERQVLAPRRDVAAPQS